MKKGHIYILSIILVAALIGIFTQELSGLIAQLFNIDILKAMAFITFSSIALFIIAPLVIFIFIHKSLIEPKSMPIYMVLAVLTGAIVSSWSLFVTAMSWG